MKIQNKLFAALIFLLSINLLACVEMEQAHIRDDCTTSAAYANGMNDAKIGDDMLTNYAQKCPINSPLLNDQYQKGFEYGIAHQPAPASAVGAVNVFNGVAGSVAKQCIRDDFEKEVCGYSCVENSFRALCSKVPTNNCVKDGFDHLTCGQNCRLDDFEHAKCDTKESSVS
jgi:hypothetical protein